MTQGIDLIDQRDTFALGVCFYPEHWPRDRNDLGFAGANREQPRGRPMRVNGSRAPIVTRQCVRQEARREIN